MRALTALIDSDTPIFEAALSAEDVELVYAQSRLDARINNIIQASGCTQYKLFVSGKGNFRKEIDPAYKANRTREDPRWREALRLHLIKEWGAIECNGYEADDACGIHQCSDGSTIICGIDKDLLQIPGKHYQWPIIRKGVVVREGGVKEVLVEQGWRNLFIQMLTGDTADNIKGIDGIGPKKAEKILAECHTEGKMYNQVLEVYLADEISKRPDGVRDDAGWRACLYDAEQQFHKNCDLLYIWRELGITYTARREMLEITN